jgi:hypothetical protein
MRRKLRIGDVVRTEPRATPFAARDRRRRANLNTLFPRISCLRNWTRPSWHGSGYALGVAPVLSRFGARETTTAAPMNQNYTLASRPQTSRVLLGWAALSRGTFSGSILLTDV